MTDGFIQCDDCGRFFGEQAVRGRTMRYLCYEPFYEEKDYCASCMEKHIK